MRTIILFLWLAAASIGGEVDIETDYVKVTAAVSPITVTLNKHHKYYAFCFSGATSEVADNNSCTFEAEPGYHLLTIVGSDFVDGVLVQATLMKSTILIVRELPDGSDTFSPIESAPAAVVQPPLPVSTKRPAKTLVGVTIYMKTAKPPYPCESCDQWNGNERKAFTAEGATIIDVVEEMDDQPFWRVKWTGSTKATKWDDQYMDRERLDGHLAALGKP